MLEARLPSAVTLKKIIDAVKELVQDANFDCNDSGIALQAMDSSHVALVALLMRAEGFDPYRCDRNIALGINFATLAKVMKCAGNDDNLTIKAGEDADVLSLMFESTNSDRISEFDIKLMDVDADHLGIPETDYSATIKMPSAEFQRICRDLSVMSETVTIEAVKDAVKFIASGDTGSGSITVKPNQAVDKKDMEVTVQLQEPVKLAFSLKYLNHFAKAATLAGSVTLSLSDDVPLMVEFAMDNDLGYLRFYLAPKIGDE
ncbi:proliferating cell nuclear antigen (pcna) [Allomyces macrogynus ATCC 38327]|uniref:DNA sliding clamp PCNA n=1 Tax=Allomyces macrogynus (strain ATCC 38327) TaxID=578462 RepID=A0A0L0RYQ2_ALLM3|nr:proliferating cell nuclear antigen (pcna) [Allomyces macrogynus ATCC 38327]|eukprot:KNE55280.1 proliferating cell nuclear antigen (pcna) [Allomyces macrogynus ATCC 38327]